MLKCVLVGDYFFKSLFSFILTSNTVSVEEFGSLVRKKVIMLQYKCSLLDIFPSFLRVSSNMLIIHVSICNYLDDKVPFDSQ
jgi:hypothetical protein